VPQFHLDNFVPQLFWLTIFFAILYFGIVQMTLPKLGRTITARETQVSGDLATAESAKNEAERLAADHAAGLEKAHHEARAAIDAAKAKATANVEAALAAANRTIAEKAATAEASLDAARVRAMSEIELVASEAAADIVERLTGRRPDAGLTVSAAKTALGA
jgi:F-type H+-transporting ATPase subunit b